MRLFVFHSHQRALGEETACFLALGLALAQHLVAVRKRFVLPLVLYQRIDHQHVHVAVFSYVSYRRLGLSEHRFLVAFVLAEQEQFPVRIRLLGILSESLLQIRDCLSGILCLTI